VSIQAMVQAKASQTQTGATDIDAVRSEAG
jgi:hypothetical protein